MVDDERMKLGVITVASASGLRRGCPVAIGMRGPGDYEFALVKAVNGNEVTIKRVHWWHWALWRVQRIARAVWTGLRLGAEWAADTVRSLIRAL
jgi:hypothetical protein